MEPSFDQIPVLANPNIANYLAQRQQGVNGREMKALAIKRAALAQSIQATGLAKPATLVNFNPVPLRTESAFNWKVPAATDESVPEDRRMKFEYKGRTYKATYLTIKEPHLYPWLKDVKQPADGDMADGVGVYDMAACYQIEIAHLFWMTYNGADPANRMGGVLVYEGDRHVITGRTTPEKLRVPTFVTLPDRKRQYFCEERDYRQFLGEQLDRQHDFCIAQMQEAAMYHADDEQRKSITQVHRAWHQFALDMAWVSKPQDWLMHVDEGTEVCEGCGAPRKRALAFFCHACTRPYDPLKAYLAGELPLDSVHMNRIGDGDWPKVRDEELRRRKLRESIMGEPGASREPKKG